MKGENEKNEVGCSCHIQHKSAVGLAMKVTHFINNTAAVGGSPVRFDGWLCISRSSAVVEADRLWGQSTISNTTWVNKKYENVSYKWQSSLNSGTPDPHPTCGPSLPFNHSFTADLSECSCFARAALGVTCTKVNLSWSQTGKLEWGNG